MMFRRGPVLDFTTSAGFHYKGAVYERVLEEPVSSLGGMCRSRGMDDSLRVRRSSGAPGFAWPHLPARPVEGQGAPGPPLPAEPWNGQGGPCPTFPPDPWSGKVAHGPTFPPDPWSGNAAHGPTFPADPDGAQIADRPPFPA